MNTTTAIRIHDLSGPEALRWEEIPVPDPGPGEVLVRQEAIGLNYGDIYRRSGIRATASLPAVIGVEAAGVVEAVGPRDEDAAPIIRAQPFKSAIESATAPCSAPTANAG